jgi:hypothetical protein
MWARIQGNMAEPSVMLASLAGFCPSSRYLMRIPNCFELHVKTQLGIVNR